MGIDVDGVPLHSALGSALASIAGVLVGVYYNTISATMGITVGLKAFVAAYLVSRKHSLGPWSVGTSLGLLETMVASSVTHTVTESFTSCIHFNRIYQLDCLVKMSGKCR